MLHVDLTIAEKAAELRRQYGGKLPDAFQAALALHHRVKLSTRNSQGFNPKRHPFVEIPYQLRS
jgi:predicted nucleic acid-binding protein